jgi:glycogen debranching enzyme
MVQPDELKKNEPLTWSAGSSFTELIMLNERRDRERQRREGFASRLQAAADAYIVRRGAGKTIIAGYPWFTDWGRDTLIALRGLCLATGRLDVARDILLAWAATVSEGMLPNRFPDQGGQAEFNAVDASLWFIIAVHDIQPSVAATKERLRWVANHKLKSTLKGCVSRRNVFGTIDPAQAAVAANPGLND